MKIGIQRIEMNLQWSFNIAPHTSGEETADPSGAPEFTPALEWGSCYSIFSFMCNVL